MLVRTSILFVALALVTLSWAACAAPSNTPTPAPTARATAAVTSAPTSAVAPTATRPPAPIITRGGTIRAAMQAESSPLDVHQAIQAFDTYILYNIHDGIVGLDENRKFVPGLAESWDLSDPKALIFKLRKGIKFHDGTDFNAAAFKFNVDRATSKSPVTRCTSSMDLVDHAEIVDDSTVKLVMIAPQASILDLLAERCGLIVSPAAVQKHGKDYQNNPVGTGPFQFAEWVRDDHITLKRNENYWRKGADDKALPYLDSVIFRPIVDEAVKLVNLRTGQVDFVDTVPYQEVDRIKQTSGIVYLQSEPARFVYFDMNLSKPPFDNKALRQAIAYTVDRAPITQRVFPAGMAAPGWTTIGPSSRFYMKELENAQVRDLAKAKAKLAEGGKPDGFSFQLEVFQIPTMISIAEIVQAQLKEVGIQAKVTPLQVTELVVRRNNKQHEVAVTYQPAFLDPDDPMYWLFHSKSAKNIGYSNPKVDELLAKEKSEMNEAKRKELLIEAWKIINEEAATVVIIHQAENAAISDKVQNFKMTPLLNRLPFFREVWMKK